MINRISICLENLKVVAKEFYNIMYFCATFESLDPFTKLGELLTELMTRAFFIYKENNVYFLIYILYVLSLHDFSIA